MNTVFTDAAADVTTFITGTQGPVLAGVAVAAVLVKIALRSIGKLNRS